MVIVLPVCHKDKEAALRNLAWCRELDPKGVPFPCLVSHEIGFDASDVISEAHRYFTAVQVHQYRPLSRNPLPWPQPQNWAWKQALMRVRKSFRDPWLWWEQDAVPLRSGWLAALADAYAKSGKPFLGAIGDDGGGQVQRHLNGVAIYPPDVLSYGPSSMYSCNTIAFDVLGGWRILNQAEVTPLIQHVWSWDTNGSRPPCTFRSVEDAAKVSKEAVLFHRCRDATLINSIRGTGNTTEIKPFVAPSAPKDFAYILMARAGDIINALPIFAESSRKHGRPVKFVCSAEFEALMQGVTYAQTEALQLDTDGLDEAINLSEKKYGRAIPIQVWSQNRRRSWRAEHFSEESWFLAGMIDHYKDFSVAPFFDARNPVEEESQVEKYIEGDQPLLVLAADGGYSSPFKESGHFKAILRDHLSKDFQIVDLCGVTMPHLYDVLGLIDQASVLVAADSSILHLAAASKTPAIALLSDRGKWAQTSPRFKPVWSGIYSKAFRDALRIVSVIREQEKRAPGKRQPTYIHTIESYYRTNWDQKRHSPAWCSWLQLYKEGKMLSAHFTTTPARDAKTALGDEYPMPFWKDIIQNGLAKARDCDVILWTNSDTAIKPEALKAVSDILKDFPIATGRHMDCVSGRLHPGRALAAFKATWLRKHWEEIPDFVMGAAETDVWMALVARREVGHKSTARELMSDDQACDIAPGSVLHMPHGPSVWDLPTRRREAPSNAHNLRLLREWCQKNNSLVKFTPEGWVDWTT